MARVVVLNGVSSVGKSSIALAVQRASEFDLARVSMDDFMSMVPKGRELDPQWFEVNRSRSEGEPIVAIRNGPRGRKLFAAMRSFVGLLADNEIDVIVDDVCTSPDVLDYRSILAAHELRIVRVDADFETIVEREAARGDRMIGLAREQSKRIHQGIGYDLTVINNDGQVQACADQILSMFR